MNAETRQLVWGRAADRCEYCRIHQDDEPFYRLHVEHIIAKQHGGSDNPDNLALACHHDNDHKGPNLTGIDPETGKVAFFIPVASAGRAISAGMAPRSSAARNAAAPPLPFSPSTNAIASSCEPT